MQTGTLHIGIAVVLLMGAGAYWITVNKPSDSTLMMNQMPITSEENPQPGSAVHDLPVEPAAAVARKDLADKLSVH